MSDGGIPHDLNIVVAPDSLRVCPRFRNDPTPIGWLFFFFFFFFIKLFASFRWVAQVGVDSSQCNNGNSTGPVW